MGVEESCDIVGVFASKLAMERWLDTKHHNLIEWNEFDESYWVMNSTVRYRPEQWDVTV